MLDSRSVAPATATDAGERRRTLAADVAESGASESARREWAAALDGALRARGIELAEVVAATQGNPVEEALAGALAAAAVAGQWAAVEALARELEARRRARAGVPSLDVARARRGGRGRLGRKAPPAEPASSRGRWVKVMTDDEYTSEERERDVDEILGRVRGIWLRVNDERPLADRWDLAALLATVGRATAKDWRAIQANLHETVVANQGFAEDYTAAAADGVAVLDILHECAHALWGTGSWAGIRRMHMALVAGDVGLQERQAKCVDKCKAAIEAWNRIDRRKPRSESRAAYQARMTGLPMRKAEEQVAKYLVIGLREHERGFHPLKPAAVAAVLREQRANVSAFALLSNLAILAGVWPNVSDFTLRAAVKAAERKATSREATAPRFTGICTS